MQYGRLITIIESLQGPDALLRQLITKHGAKRADLMDLGLTDYRARAMIGNTDAPNLADDQANLLPPLGLPPVVALVPVADQARRFLKQDVYLRDLDLQGQLRLSATHLGWSDDGEVKLIRPITRRWLIGSTAAIPALGLTNTAAIMSEPDIGEWGGQATLLELGPSQPVGLPLGFRPHPSGRPSAIAGVRHVLLDDLLATAKAGGTLLDVPRL